MRGIVGWMVGIAIVSAITGRAQADEQGAALIRFQAASELVRIYEQVLQRQQRELDVARTLAPRALRIMEQYQAAPTYLQRAAAGDRWTREIVQEALGRGGVARSRYRMYDPEKTAAFLSGSSGIAATQRELEKYRVRAGEHRASYEALRQARPSRTPTQAARGR